MIRNGEKIEKGQFNLADKIKSFRDLEVYKTAFAAAMEIYQISKAFPLSHLLPLWDAQRDGKEGGFVLSSLILTKWSSILHRS